MTPISTNISLDYFLFKHVSELDKVYHIVPSLTKYLFNSHTKSMVRKAMKINDSLEIVTEYSWKAQDDVKENANEY